MKLSRPLQFAKRSAKRSAKMLAMSLAMMLAMSLAMSFAALAVSSSIVRANTGCPDDPERCIERGATAARRTVVISNAVHSVSAPAAVTPAASAPRLAVKPATPAPVKKAPAKPARPTPSVSTPTPATPGMGMLLKMSSGTGGDVSWFPSRPVDTNSASWVL